MDPSDHVRQALASVMNDMSPVLGRENTINHLLPMLLTLLRDTNPEVRNSLRGESGVTLERHDTRFSQEGGVWMPTGSLQSLARRRAWGISKIKQRSKKEPPHSRDGTPCGELAISYIDLIWNCARRKTPKT